MSISPKLSTPDPPSPTPTGPTVVTAMPSATSSTMVLDEVCEDWPRPNSDSAAEDWSPVWFSSSQLSR